MAEPPRALKSGYMYKQGAKRKSWKQRFFLFFGPVMDGKIVVKPAQLAYYKTAHVKGRSPCGVIFPADRLSVMEDDSIPAQQTYRYGLTITVPGRTYYMLASTPADREEWIRLIMDAKPVDAPSLAPSGSSTFGAEYKTPLPAPSNRARVRSTGEAIVSSHICQGYLRKEGYKIKNWKRRWFTLKGAYVYYYKDRMIPNPLGQIDLNDCDGAGARDDPDLLNGFDIVTQDRTYLLQAETPEERDMWLNAVAAVLNTRNIEYITEANGARTVRTRSEALDGVTRSLRKNGAASDGVDTPSEHRSMASVRMSTPTTPEEHVMLS
eukprot:m.150851 g.150851  ORF g.150851 m.150851 type:complete len:322 (-) comp16324_c0_seq3:3349-4314(-)